MRGLKIVINKDTEPKVIKLNQYAVITLGYTSKITEYDENTGYNDLYIGISNAEISQFEQDNIKLIDRFIHKVESVPTPGFTVYLIFCNDYTIMN